MREQNESEKKLEEKDNRNGNAETTASFATTGKNSGGEGVQKNDKSKSGDLSAIKARSNFNETAFFFPQLQTNEKGEIVIKFTAGCRVV